MKRSLLLSLLFALPCLFFLPLDAAGTVATRTLGKITMTCADQKVKPFGLAKIQLNGADPKRYAIVWRVSPGANVSKASTTRDRLEFTAPPGVYTVECLLISRSGEEEDEELSLTVEFESCCPKQPEPKQPDKKPDPFNAIGRISFPPFGCSATIIGPRRADGRWDVLTAAHCVEHFGNPVGQVGTMRMRDGKSFSIRVVSYHKYPAPDLCWCITEDANLDLPFASVGDDNPPWGVKVWHAGYGVDVPGNREDGDVVSSAEDANGQIHMNLSVSKGDSGGGIFRTDTGDLVSVVCCTSSFGNRAFMKGASTNNIRKTRPTQTAPLVDEWKPAEMPKIAAPAPVYEWRWINGRQQLVEVRP